MSKQSVTGALSIPGPRLHHTGADGTQGHPATPCAHEAPGKEDLKVLGVLSGEMQQGSSCILISLSRHQRAVRASGLRVQWQVLAELLEQGRVWGSALECRAGDRGVSAAAEPRGTGFDAGVEGSAEDSMPGWRARSRRHGAGTEVLSRGLSAGEPLLFAALPPPPSAWHEAGAGGSRPWPWHAAAGRGTGRARAPLPAPFSVSPVTETLRWQSRAWRPWEGGGVCPSSARPPSIVGGGGGTCSGRRRPGCSCSSRRRGDAAAVPGPQLAAGGRRCCLCLPGPAAASGNEHESARPRLLLHAQLLCKCCFLFPFSPPWKRGRKPAALSSSRAGGGILWICPGRRGIPLSSLPQGAGGHRGASLLPWPDPRAQRCPVPRAELGRPWALCWAPQALCPAWSGEITVREQPSLREPRTPSLAAAVQDPPVLC